MKVKVLRAFIDKETKEVRRKGDILKVSPNRLMEILKVSSDLVEVNFNDFKVNELKKLLDYQKIDYSSDLNKAGLVALLEGKDA